MLLKRVLAVLLLTAAFATVLPLSGVFASSGVAADTPQPAPEVVGPNLLTNPGMDGAFVKQCSLRNGPQWVQVPCPADYNAQTAEIKMWETTQVPFGWSAWWRQPNSNFDDPNYYSTWPAYCPNRKSVPADCVAHHNPEYRDTMGGPQEKVPSRKVAGDNSQKYFTFYSIHEAGIYQVVSGVKPGDRVRFSAYMEAWSAGNNDPYKSDFNQHMNLQVGIDPTGGNDPWSSNVVWTAPAESFDKFTQFVVETVAKNSVVSVWTRSAPTLALQHVDVYIDEASLNVVQPAKVAAPVRPTRVVTSTRIITSTRLITGTNGVVSRQVFTQSVIVTRTAPVATTPSVAVTRLVTSTRIITSTRLITGTNGVVSRQVFTQSVILTRTMPVTTSTQRVTTTKSISSTGPVTTPASSKPVSGTLPIPAAGTYRVVKGDTLIAIARRFGITPWWRLAELNNLQEPYRIEIGQVLKLQ